MQNEQITLGGGCFWCLEAVFDQVRGVVAVESGYAGGKTINPSYNDVCSGMTGHAEVVRVTFDPDQITLAEIFEIFFAIHDPTTLNRQGADVGTQYRSAIFYHTPEQKTAAEETIAALNEAKLWPNPLVTEVAPLSNYSEAEDYHQEYFANNARQPYCQMVVAPKVAKFRHYYAERAKEA